jgi:hypothetical protein
VDSAGSARPQVNRSADSNCRMHPWFAAMAWKRSAQDLTDPNSVRKYQAEDADDETTTTSWAHAKAERNSGK